MEGHDAKGMNLHEGLNRRVAQREELTPSWIEEIWNRRYWRCRLGWHGAYIRRDEGARGSTWCWGGG